MPSTPSSRPAFIDAPLPDIQAWTHRLQDADSMPILESTAVELELMRRHEDRVDANGLGELISGDPLMTLKVMAYASSQRSLRAVTDMETVTATLVMMGIPPFFRAFGPQPTIEERLTARPAALAGLEQTLRRARQAARYALSFAVHRMDPDAPIIYAATLLHDFAELLIWCHAPDLALRITEAQRQDPTLRSSDVQRQVLHVELPDLQQALMKVWRLPALLVSINDERHATRPQVRCVHLAVRLARHSAHGWDNPALPDDLADIGRLLNLSTAAVAELVRDR